ncbi:MAG: TlpA family protein disulfide reductase [Muribaculaceae bacterium]|nr:TlpA family protein disulfide reductase [Muribaculaceae bacterium]
MIKLKAIIAFAIVTAAAVFTSCSQKGPRTIENPIINYSNTTTIDIVGVELTDSCTILTVQATFMPNHWIRIVPETTLQADGKTYRLIAADGIEPGKEFWMPESGKATFTLTFEPLPFSTEKFDFIEGNEPGAFRLWDIDITGKQRDKYPAGLPKSLENIPNDGPMPDFAFGIGETTVNVHMLPYRPEFGNNLNLYVNSIQGSQQEYTIKIDSLGNGSVSFPQYGTAHGFIVFESGYSGGSYTLYPGETLDCYIDMRMTGEYTMSNREDFVKSIYRKNYHTGHYSALDRLMAEIKKPYYGLGLHTGTFADYHMNGREYMDMVKSKYDQFCDSIASFDASDMAKEMMMYRLKDEVLQAMSEMTFLLQHNYRHVHNSWREPVPADSINATLTDSDYAEVATWFDINDPKLLFAGADGLTAHDWSSTGAAADLSKSVRMFVMASRKIGEQQFTDADRDSLRALSNQFYATACDSIDVRTRRKIMELTESKLVTPTPDVAPDKVFDAIIAPHKGKIVVVDLWNTWCGPCRGALAANEPLKTGELANDDIVWIYIADDSSDASKYLEMIPDIKGIHFKITADQINSIRSRFNVDGIPYYIIVDRNGKAEGRPDLRNHSTYVETIKSKL